MAGAGVVESEQVPVIAGGFYNIRAVLLADPAATDFRILVKEYTAAKVYIGANTITGTLRAGGVLQPVSFSFNVGATARYCSLSVGGDSVDANAIYLASWDLSPEKPWGIRASTAQTLAPGAWTTVNLATLPARWDGLGESYGWTATGTPGAANVMFDGVKFYASQRGTWEFYAQASVVPAAGSSLTTVVRARAGLLVEIYTAPATWNTYLGTTPQFRSGFSDNTGIAVPGAPGIAVVDTETTVSLHGAIDLEWGDAVSLQVQALDDSPAQAPRVGSNYTTARTYLFARLVNSF